MTDAAVCVLLVDQSIRCWRDFEMLQTGTPTPPPQAGAFTTISTDGFSECGIRVDATVACWSYDEGSQDSPSGTFVAVSGPCGIATDQTLVCWWHAQEGGPVMSMPLDGTIAAISTPCAIRAAATLACWADLIGSIDPPTGTFIAVGAGYETACAIRTSGTLACWGDDSFGQVEAPAGTYIAVAMGQFAACAIRSDGTLVCWGDGRSKPWTPLGGTFTTLSIAYGGCAIRTDQSFACWGEVAWPPRPTAQIRRMPKWQLSRTVAVHWGAIEALAPITTYDVRRKAIPWNAPPRGWQPWRTATTTTKGTVRLSPGTTTCFSERAHDAAGRTSAWTDEQSPLAGQQLCTTVPLDDRRLSGSRGWTRISDDRFYRSGALRTSRRGAALSLGGVRGGQAAIVATTCPTCGTVRILLNGDPIRTIDLSSATRHDRVLIRAASATDLYGGGTFTIKVISDGRKVLIDGLAMFRVGPNRTR